MKILLKMEVGAQAPVYSTKEAAGADIRAFLPDGPITLLPGEFRMIPTGIRLEIPVGYEVQVRPRSGLAAKHGITVLNSPGTIDSDYRGEVKVILINHGKEEFIINSGDRIAQLVAARVEQALFQLSDELNDSERGEGGFGSTGV
ncbi:MAG: dUTP diphosphatase [Spirochaetales bacterium]|nr:dUTP diphosphatase [Spirochaetales bacterium]